MDEKRIGNEWYAKGKYQKAIETYSRGIAKIESAGGSDPDRVLPALYGNRCQSNLDLRRYREASADATRALNLDGGLVKAYYRRGQARGALRQFESAVEDFARVVELDATQTEIISEATKLIFADLTMAQKTKNLSLADEALDDVAMVARVVIKMASDLRNFTLSGNAFEGVFPEGCFAVLKCLKILKLDRNPLTDISDILFSIPSLETFSCCEGKIETLRVPASGSISPIVTLLLTNNAITDIPDDFFLQTPKLRELSLAKNMLQSLPTSIGHVKTLEALGASFNRLTAMPLSWDACAVLKEVDVSSNVLTCLPPSLLLATPVFKIDISANAGLQWDDVKRVMGVEWAAFDGRRQAVVNKGLHGGLVVNLS